MSLYQLLSLSGAQRGVERGCEGYKKT